MTDTKHRGRDNRLGKNPGSSRGADLATIPEDQGAPMPTNGDPPKATKSTSPPANGISAPDGVTRRPGPRRSRAKPHRRVIHVYVSPEQYAEITARSARRNLAISEYMRVRALRGAIPIAYLLRSVMDQQAHDSLTNTLRILDDTGRRLRDLDGNITDEDVQVLLDELHGAIHAIHGLTEALQPRKP